MKHKRCINDDTLRKEFVNLRRIIIEIKVLNTNPFTFLASLELDGIRRYDGIADTPMCAIDRALYQIAGEDYTEDELST